MAQAAALPLKPVLLLALAEGLTLRDAAARLGFVSPEDFDRWVRPEVAFAELADREHPFRLMPPTSVSLVDIADCLSCLQAHERASARQAIQYAPRMVFVEDGICFLYDGDAGYAQENIDAQGPRHRTYMVDGQLEYIRQG